MLAASMMEWQNDEDAADAGDETTEGQHMSSDDGLGFEEGIDDLSDEFGDFGDDLDDGFDDDDFGGFGDDNSEELAELEDRIGELENEVSAISSGMNTVREENKQIGETVEELDDTIRKLLDIYEMVTRGINPFVDDAREMGGLDGGGAFGLFEAEAEDEEHLDPEVANADAESFFDDDFGELDAEEGAKEAELAAEDELVEAERESPADALDDGDDEADETDEADDSGGAGGASFDDLKEQYEEGGGWDDEDDAEADDAGTDLDDDLDAETDLDDESADLEDESEDEALDDVDPVEAETDDDEEADVEAVDDLDDAFDDEPLDPEAEVEDADGDVRKTLDELEAEYATAAANDEPSGDDEAAAEPEPSASVEASDAYLTGLPSNYVSEVLVLEWAEHLVSVGGALGASRALRQYREQDWISRAVESELNAHIGQIAPSVEDADDHELRIDDHQTSLAYVCRLAEDVPRGQLYEELVAYGGRFDGIRC
ncbi:flagella accessory protein C [Haloferax sulfurifontis]|uniref:Fla cluster protein FlaCE n=1 Tax=Haloferax sulfurifontis ATCC BAA-897 TaxID=662480 RepID=M0IP41_9EURY|nr:flagella accessory protein C [Haloferax sulfurifontis]ELZ98576.1 fla cluster protein FlaCE [Haloferax sulfurifontis ATCC BAA-897]